MTHVSMSTNLVFVNNIIVKKNMVGTFLTKIADHRHLNLEFPQCDFNIVLYRSEDD